MNSLSNDSDPEGDTLTITGVQQPSNGKAEIVDGKIVYTPNDGFSGVETFTYTISDGNGGTATATETVTVGDRPNTDPKANDDSATTPFNTAVTLNTVGNDTDPEGDDLKITSVQQPANGTAVISADGKRIVYTPNAGFTGTESFSYTISDGNGGSDSATETVTVGDRPNTDPKANDDSATTPFNTAVTLNTVGNDTDPEGDDLKITSVQQPANGTAVISADGKRIVYTPNAGFTGTESFSYTISDGNGGSDSGN